MELIRATLRHNECWSPFLGGFPDVRGELLTQNVNDNTVVGNIAFYSSKLKEKSYFVRFFRELKARDAIIEIKRVKKNGLGDTRFINLVAKKNNSISSFIFETGSLVFKEFFYRGYEVWYFSPGSNNGSKLKSQLSERAQVLDWEPIPAERYFTMFSVLNDTVRPRYEELFSFLIDRGYFEYPHNITIEDVANSLKTTKSNISRKIRQIEKDMAASYQRKREITEVVNRAITKSCNEEFL